MTHSRRDCLQALAALAAGVGGAAPSAWAQSAKATGLPAVGAPLRSAPSVALLNGGQFKAVDGQVQVYYWWASWCPFCALQSPHMDKLWQAHKNSGLQMLAISIDKNPQDAKAYLAKKGYTFPVAMSTPALARAFPKPPGLPVTLVRGKDGRVAMAESGEIFPEDVEQIAQFL
jgi:thiol-disulfide isomerase/thioredoxin